MNPLSEEPLELPGRGVIGILTGGISNERKQSLKSGSAVTESLRRQGYQVRIFDTAEPAFREGVRETDVAFLAIAGQYAEDGKLQGFLETLGIPYTGSGVLASALAMNKPAAKVMVRASGVPIFDDIRIDPCEDPETAAQEIVSRLGLPVILKPESEGSSIGTEIGRSEFEIAEMLKTHRRQGTRVFAEPFENAKIITVGVLELENGPMALIPLEIRTSREFFDFSAKQQADLRSFHCPAELPSEQLQALTNFSLRAHVALGCSGYSRSDFVVSKDGGIRWLELNTLPSLMQTATLARMAASIGISYDAMIRLILGAGIRKNGYRP